MPTALPFVEEPDYELTDADLEEAYLDNLGEPPVDELLVDAAIEDAIMGRIAERRAA